MSRFCTGCGAPLEPDVKFCSQCGARAADSASRPLSETARLPAQTAEPSNDLRAGVTSSIAQESPTQNVKHRQGATAAARSATSERSVETAAYGISKSRGHALWWWGTAVVVVLAGTFFFVRSQLRLSDAGIARNVKAAFFTSNLRRLPIDVTSRTGIVTLVGHVDDQTEEAEAVRIAGQQAGVKQVIDQLVLPEETDRGSALGSNPLTAGSGGTAIQQEGAEAIWLGFANGNVAQDRDADLRRNCGDFKRVYVPDNVGNKFTDLCGYVTKTCEKVCDWEGTSIPCDAVSQGGNRDGTRVALCRPSNSPTSSAVAAGQNIRSVDFQNFDYTSNGFAENGPPETIHISNGQANSQGEEFWAAKPTYGDLKGDGREEAVVALSCHPSGMSPNVASSELFIFEMSETGPKILVKLSWKLERVTAARVEQNQLTVDFLQVGNGGQACPEWIVSKSFRWNGDRFLSAGEKRGKNSCFQ